MFNLHDAKRRINFLLTALGLRQKGFFTPYDYLAFADMEIEAYPAITADFLSRKAAFRDFLEAIDANQPFFLAMQGDSNAPSWASPFLSRLDAAAIYTGITRFRPQRVIEVGSGNSTHFLCRAIADHGLTTKVICIDPAPRTSISDLPVTVLQRVVTATDVEMMAVLAPGDILFIDSSHLLQQGFDVDILFNRVFPALAPGVIIHVHDIFLPYGYPPSWQSYRFNEQMALIGLMYSGFFETVFASHYVWRDMRRDLQAICPDFPLDTPDNGCTLWLRKACRLHFL